MSCDTLKYYGLSLCHPTSCDKCKYKGVKLSDPKAEK